MRKACNFLLKAKIGEATSHANNCNDGKTTGFYRLVDLYGSSMALNPHIGLFCDRGLAIIRQSYVIREHFLALTNIRAREIIH